MIRFPTEYLPRGEFRTMRISESKIRKIIREEARLALREGFDIHSGLPNSADAVRSVIRDLMGQLDSLDLEGREKITLRIILANAGNDNQVMDKVAASLSSNKAMWHKQLGIEAPAEAKPESHPAAPPPAAKASAPAARPSDDDEDDDDDDKVRRDYRQKIMQGIASGRKDWDNFPGPGKAD